jgi:hypothetical protein
MSRNATMYSAENMIGPLQQDSAFELSFRLRHPLPAKARACVVLLHGVGGNETNLAQLASAVAPDTLVVPALSHRSFDQPGNASGLCGLGHCADPVRAGRNSK